MATQIEPTAPSPLHTFSAPTAKRCRHRKRGIDGRCLDCRMHADPAPAIGGRVLPSAALCVRI